MTPLTMRVIKGDFIVTGPDVEPMTQKKPRRQRIPPLAPYEENKGECRYHRDPEVGQVVGKVFL